MFYITQLFIQWSYFVYLVYFVYFGVHLFPYNWCGGGGAWCHIGSEVTATVQGNEYGNKMTFHVTPTNHFIILTKPEKFRDGFSCYDVNRASRVSRPVYKHQSQQLFLYTFPFLRLFKKFFNGIKLSKISILFIRFWFSFNNDHVCVTFDR